MLLPTSLPVASFCVSHTFLFPPTLTVAIFLGPVHHPLLWCLWKFIHDHTKFQSCIPRVDASFLLYGNVSHVGLNASWTLQSHTKMAVTISLASTLCQTPDKSSYCYLGTKWCLILCYFMDYSPPGSSVHGISQARILEWVVIFFSRGPSRPRDQTHISCLASRFLTAVTWEAG